MNAILKEELAALEKAHNPDHPQGVRPIRAGGAKPPPPRQINVRELLGDSRELRIVHDGQEYRLSMTSKGKLILTK